MKLIPAPKKIDLTCGAFKLENCQIALMANCDIRITKAAITLKNEIEAVTGVFVKTAATHLKKNDKTIYISYAEGGDEGYTVSITDDKIDICGNSAAGAFYGVQTLRQIIGEYKNELPACQIEDKPDFNDRGFYHDVTRGRVTTLDTLKKLVDRLASLKINALQLYIEDAFLFYEFDGVITRDAALTADEIVELDDYCYNNFIELVPSLSTFGHLFTLLDSEKYRHLCELEDHKKTAIYWIEKQHHHTIDAANPESIEVIKSMIDQYILLFRSNRFNICCDETNDLCKGRNKDKDSGEMYFYFTRQIIEHVRSYGKQVQMWGDVVLAHLELAKEYLQGVTVLNWNYTKVANEWIIKDIKNTGFEQIICPGTTSWNYFVEHLDISESNISGLARHGINHGAVGILNTNWGDFGNICSLNCELIGMAIGAECGWNPGCEIGENFKMAASYIIFNSNENVYDMIYELGLCEETCDWTRFVYWYSQNYYEGRNNALEIDEAKTLANVKKVDKLVRKIKKAVREGEILDDLLLAARAIKLMNKVHLLIKGTEGYTDREALKAEWEKWLKAYSKAWMRDDKPSQLHVLDEFLTTFIDTL